MDVLPLGLGLGSGLGLGLGSGSGLGLGLGLGLGSKTTLDTPGCANMDSLAPPVTRTAPEPGSCVSALMREPLDVWG